MTNLTDYLEYRKRTYKDKIQEDYDLYIAIFGKDHADKWLENQRPVHRAFLKLWKEHGIKTYGQYEDWEKEHIDERNEFLKKEGVYDLWLNG